MEKISVLITTFNDEMEIESCLESVIHQTYKNIEIIIIDDGSTDNTLNIVKKYVNKDSRVKYMTKKNRGIAHSRNLAIEKSNCRYVTFIDADDKVTYDYVEYLVDLIEKFDCRISTCAHQSMKRDSTLKTIKNPKKYFWNDYDYFLNLGNGTMPYQIGVSPWGRLYDISLFKNIKYPDGRKFEDSATTYKLIMEAGGTAIGEEIKYFYYRNTESIVQKEFSYDRFEFIDAERAMHDDVIKKYPLLKSSMDRRFNYAEMNTLGNLLISRNRYKYISEAKLIKGKLMRNYFRKLFDKRNKKKDYLGYVSLAFGLYFYGVAFKTFKKIKK